MTSPEELNDKILSPELPGSNSLRILDTAYISGITYAFSIWND